MNYALRIAEQLKPHLRGLRKSRGLTQAQLGALVGVGQARIAEIEAKPGAVSLDQLVKVLAALGATLQLNPGDTDGAKDGLMLAQPNPLVRPTAKAAGSDVRFPEVDPEPPAKTQRPRKPMKPAVPRVAVTIPAKKGVW